MIKQQRKTPVSALVLTAFLFIYGGTSVYAQEILVEPPCSNSKCISLDMVAVAHHQAGGQHAAVEFDDMPSYILELSHAEPCVDPRPSGVTVFKQIPGRTIEFPDTFCTNQGCTPHADGSECQ